MNPFANMNSFRATKKIPQITKAVAKQKREANRPPTCAACGAILPSPKGGFIGHRNDCPAVPF
jgi:hypothetical protein